MQSRKICSGPATVFWVVIILATFQLSMPATAQNATPDNQGPSSWIKATDVNASGLVPTRIRETHQEVNGRVIDTRTVEKLSVNGGYEPYDEIETESIQIDKSTVRVIQRRFGRNPDGSRTLITISEEQRSSTPDGRQKAVRTVSAPDLNGSFSVTQRVVSETVRSSPDTQQTTTTVMLPDVNGGFTVGSQTQRIEQQDQSGNTYFRESTQVPTVNGGLMTGEVIDGSVQKTGDKSSKREERISRSDINGGMSVTQHTVTREWESAPGNRHQETQVFSQAPGSSTGNPLQVTQKATTEVRSDPGGGKISQQQLQQLRPGLPDEGISTTQIVVDISRPAGSGATEEKQTVHTMEAGGTGPVVTISSEKLLKATPGTTATKDSGPTPH